jgi:hypothetical protein
MKLLAYEDLARGTQIFFDLPFVSGNYFET